MKNSKLLDRTGVFASVGCAIHCMVAPIVLLAAPALGGVWVNPMTHILIALLVLPVAAFALRSGFRTHRRRWILSAGVMGMVLVVSGTAAPFLPSDSETAATNTEGCDHCQNCCPNVVTEEDGTTRLKIPIASILTMLGGVALVTAHVGNLRCCALCRRR